MAASPSFLLDNPTICLATYQGVMLLWWRSPPTLEGMLRLNRTFQEYLQVNPGRMHFLILSSPTEFFLDEATRKAMIEGMRQTEASFASITVALRSEGFLAASLRAVLTGIKMVVRPHYPVKIVTTLQEAIQNLRIHTRGVDVLPLLRAAKVHDSTIQIEMKDVP